MCVGVLVLAIAGCSSSSPGLSKRDGTAGMTDTGAGPAPLDGGFTDRDAGGGDLGTGDRPGGDSVSPGAGDASAAETGGAADRTTPPPDGPADASAPPADAARDSAVPPPDAPIPPRDAAAPDTAAPPPDAAPPPPDAAPPPPDAAPPPPDVAPPPPDVAPPPPDVAPPPVDAPPPLPVGTCFPPVSGVPGAGGAAPAWWSGGAPLGSATTRWIDDPRWRGAASYDHLGDFARFRALVETVGQAKFLVLSWFVKVDISGPFDRLYVGFFDEAVGQGNVFRLTRQHDQATAVGGASYFDAGFSGRAFYWQGAGWVAKSGAPPPLSDWLKNDTRVDVFCAAAGCQAWAIRMRIPIDPAAMVDADNQTGVRLTSNRFRFWYEIQESIGGTLTPSYSWPTGLAAATEAGGAPPIQFPDPAGWSLVDLGRSCAGEIALDPGQIYLNSPGNTQVSLTSANTFHARPRNTTGAPLSNATIKATFRLAGANAAGASPAWEVLCDDVAGAPAVVPPGGQFDLACGPWSVPDPCAYRPAGDACGPTAGTRSRQQAVLVDLAVAGSGDSARFISPQSDVQAVQF